MACSPVTARKTENWPVTHKNSWHISAIKESDIRKMASINTPGGYYVQGGVVTEDYYAFAVFGGDGANNYVYLAKRSSGKVVDKYSGYFGHMNSFYP